MRKAKRLIPVLGTKGVDIPVYIEALHYRDFTEEANYSARLAELLADIRGDRRRHPTRHVSRHQRRISPFRLCVAHLPERPEALAALRNALITDDGGRHIALTAVQGMGGVGKTVLAQALCHDEVVQQAFPRWHRLDHHWQRGNRPSMPSPACARSARPWATTSPATKTSLAAKNQYRSTIRKKAALIVVDDVWRSGDLEPLRAEDSPRSRLLFTTRDASIAAALGAREHVADLLTEEQSREALAQWTRTEITHLPPIAAQLIHECGRLPLALSMVGAMLRGRPANYRNVVLLSICVTPTSTRSRPSFPTIPTPMCCAPFR